MRRAGAVAIVAAVVAVASCTTAVPTAAPGVERLGAAVLRYRGAEFEVVLGYRFAAANLGEDCLILDVAMSGATGKAVEIERRRIALRTPTGEWVPLASQEEFAREFRRLQPLIRRAAIASDPLDYWAGRVPCGTELFVVPGEGVAFDALTVNDRRVCSGRLFFFPPGGVQAGTYTLRIELPETEVRIPFSLGR